MLQASKLRIAIFTDTFFPQVNGVVTSIASTAAELKKRGYSIKIFAPRSGSFKDAQDWKKFDVVGVRSLPFFSYGSYRMSAPFSFSAQKAFHSFSPQLVHCHTPFSLGWMGKRLAEKKGIPWIATYHTLLPEFLIYLPIPFFNQTQLAKELTWKYTKLFYKKTRLVTTPSKEMARELKKHGISARFVSNPLQFDLFNQFANSKKPVKEFRLVFFGRISFEKNIDVLLKALKILLEKGHNIKLFIVGNGPAETALQKQARVLGIQKKVVFTGVLRGSKLAKKVASCHCTVTASTIETQGLTILEGMAAGLPCIGANWLAIPAAIKENQTGFLFPPFKPKICAQKIEKLLKSRALQKKFFHNAVKTAKPYSVQKICDEWENVYQKAASKH